MSDENSKDPEHSKATEHPTDTSRRRFLGGVAVLGVGATLSACGHNEQTPGKPVERPLSPAELDRRCATT